MERLEKIRTERKKLEVIESKLIQNGKDESLHAWAARELKLVADSIRSEGQELQTSRLKYYFPQVDEIQKDDISPDAPGEGVINADETEQSPLELLSLCDSSIPLKSSRIIQDAVTVVLADIPPIRSERATTESSPVVGQLASLTWNTSVSLEDQRMDDDSLRQASPEPWTAHQILDSFIEEMHKEESARREVLGLHARAQLAEIPDENLPPLATVEKRTKKGVSLTIDLSSFRTS
jgi:hypothetical protein